jgi:hypothetical protein
MTIERFGFRSRYPTEEFQAEACEVAMAEEQNYNRCASLARTHNLDVRTVYAAYLFATILRHCPLSRSERLGFTASCFGVPRQIVKILGAQTQVLKTSIPS